MLKHLRRYVIAGLLVWLPLAVTYQLLKFVVGQMDSWLDKAFALLRPDTTRTNCSVFRFPGSASYSQSSCSS